MRGKIYSVNSQKGFGFITSIDIPFTKIFFHWSALNNHTTKFTELKKGMIVEFESLPSNSGGYRAIKIEVINNPINEAETVSLNTFKDDL